jgi:hypothetical protein
VFPLCGAFSAFLGRSLYDDDISAFRPGRPRLHRCGPAFAATVNLKAELKSSNEVPPVDSQGSGSVTATFDTASKQLSWKGSVTGLSGPATAAHFHSAESGKNGAVVVPIAGADKGTFEGSATLTDTGRGLDGWQVVREHSHRRQQGRGSSRSSHEVAGTIGRHDPPALRRRVCFS